MSLPPPWAPAQRWSFWPAALCCGPRRTCTSAHRASFLITCGLIAFFFPRQVGLADSTLFSSLMPRLQGIRDELHTGAMLFSAVFLLNEPYTCAHHRHGRILYGALVGIATMGFRYFGVYETGVCFALLAVNSVSALD
ncbi:MAG: RnfABCDGE type electron transport complex subunit D [Faecalibacterium prausnitzii]